MASFGKTIGKIGSLGQYGMDPGMSVFLQALSNWNVPESYHVLDEELSYLSSGCLGNRKILAFLICHRFRTHRFTLGPLMQATAIFKMYGCAFISPRYAQDYLLLWAVTRLLNQNAKMPGRFGLRCAQLKRHREPGLSLYDPVFCPQWQLLSSASKLRTVLFRGLCLTCVCHSGRMLLAWAPGSVLQPGGRALITVLGGAHSRDCCPFEGSPEEAPRLVNFGYFAQSVISKLFLWIALRVIYQSPRSNESLWLL